MTSEDSLDIREVIFINERCRVDYESMPIDVRESADQAIDALQNARRLPAKLCQPLHAKLSGITEIRLAHDDNTYRVYVSLKCPWIIMVLDAGIKKSTEGKNIPSWQQERLETRYKKARDYWTGHDAELKTDYDQRKARREAFAKENGR
jgi:putative component of toxin-antitoxin plasmid stabilization module